METITIRKLNKTIGLTPPYPCWLIERNSEIVVYAINAKEGIRLLGDEPKFKPYRYSSDEFTFERYDLFKGEINIKIT